jgi:hypothetical protein
MRALRAPPFGVFPTVKDPGKLMRALRAPLFDYKVTHALRTPFFTLQTLHEYLWASDEIISTLKDPGELIRALRAPLFEYKVTGAKSLLGEGLKDTNSPLVQGVYRDSDNTLCWGAKRLCHSTKLNLFHDYTTRRAVTGVPHFLNATPNDWTSKRQPTIETATYGPEFSAARTATKQIMDLRYTLRMMGVYLDGPAWLFGDNEGVIKSSNLPHSTLKKRHNALSFHRVREAVARKVMYFLHIPDAGNPSDCLTKFLARAVSYPFVKAVLLWRGDTLDPDMADEEGDITVRFAIGNIDGE